MSRKVEGRLGMLGRNTEDLTKTQKDCCAMVSERK